MFVIAVSNAVHGLDQLVGAVVVEGAVEDAVEDEGAAAVEGAGKDEDAEESAVEGAVEGEVAGECPRVASAVPDRVVADPERGTL